MNFKAVLFALGALLLAVSIADARALHGGAALPFVNIVNYNGAGLTANYQVTHFDTDGNQLDAHSSQIFQDGNTFYLIGEAYDCGFQFFAATPIFCGFKQYSSTDLIHWTYVGYMFDATTPTWQSRCAAMGCFFSRMVHNAANNNWVFWVMDFAGSTANGEFVFLCTSALGSTCTQTTDPTHFAHPKLLGASLFVDPNTNIGYAIYSSLDVGTFEQIYIEQLNSSYTDSAGGTSLQITSGSTRESNTMFYHAGQYYILYGTGGCAYCTSSVTYAVSATSPMGTYGAPVTLNATSCQGQMNSMVDVLNIRGVDNYIYASDQWNTFANEGMANLYYQSLTFTGTAIDPFSCNTSTTVAGLSDGGVVEPPTSPGADQSSFAVGYTVQTNANAGDPTQIWQMQTFVPTVSTLSKIRLPLGQQNGCLANGTCGGGLNADPIIKLVTVDGSNNPVTTLASVTVPASSLSWSLKMTDVVFNYSGLTPGAHYGIIISSTATQGATMQALYTGTTSPYPAGVLRYSSDHSTWITNASAKALMFATFP